MVAGISHDIAFDMCLVGCNDIPNDHVVCFLAMWDAFWSCVLFSQMHRKFQLKSEIIKTWHKISPYLYGVWGNTP